MNQNHVNLEHAQLLKEAGWKWETEKVFFWTHEHPEEKTLICAHQLKAHFDWLPAPNLSELREELDKLDMTDGEWQLFFERSLNKPCSQLGWMNEYSHWLLHVTTDPNALARIWVWKEKR